MFFKKKGAVNNIIRAKIELNPLDSVIWKSLVILDIFGEEL